MRYAYALKAPAQNFTLPAWVTVHNAEMAGAALVIILLAFAVLRLSKGGGKPAAPPPAPKKSGSPKLLLLALLGGAGFWYWDTHLRHAAAAGPANAAPVPSPSPTPTVTRTVAPHATVPHFTLPHFLTGGDVVAIYVIGGIVAIAIVLAVLREVVMIAAAILAASLLAPAGTATIQGYPVCLPVTAQPGSTYALHVSASPGILSVAPAHDAMERRLHQVPPSWVSFGSPGPDQVSSVRLTVPSDAAPGAYWSDIGVTSAPAGSGQLRTGTAGTAAFVFTVGPSATPPPPCGALTVAYSTGRFPAWPSKAFATTGWQQVGAEEQRDNPKPVTSPTAGGGTVSAPAAQYAPASPAASQGSAGSGNAVRIAGILLVAAGLFLLMRRRR